MAGKGNVHRLDVGLDEELSDVHAVKAKLDERRHEGVEAVAREPIVEFELLGGQDGWKKGSEKKRIN